MFVLSSTAPPLVASALLRKRPPIRSARPALKPLREYNRAPGLQVRYLTKRMHRQTAMRRRRMRRVEALAGGGQPADVPIAVPGCPADFAPADDLERRRLPGCRRNVLVRAAEAGATPVGRVAALVGRLGLLGKGSGREDESGEGHAKGSLHSHPHASPCCCNIAQRGGPAMRAT